jgi:hypothetical protein
MTETRRSRRPSKVALKRIKVLAIILSFVAFVGSLAGVAIANPATANRQTAVVQSVAVGQSQVPSIQAPSNGGNFFLPAAPQMPRVRPMTRTRGS